jgi:hypothetical protein
VTVFKIPQELRRGGNPAAQLLDVQALLQQPRDAGQAGSGSSDGG